MKYEEATVTELSEGLRNGEVTAAGLLAEAKRVISEKNPAVRAFIDTYDAADADAERADAMLRDGTAGPLTGIPVAVKDNICVKGCPVTAGSKILEGFVSPYDATVIEKLRAAGAMLIGRTNMDEFAMGSSTEYSVYGTTYNPSDTERVSGGSSGGSAAAVAMGAVPLALGSDTGGSIRQPASFCGVVGLKPTYGAVSRHGLIALSSSLDGIGPLARCTDDAALLFSVIAGKDTYDSTCGMFAASPAGHPRVIGVPDNLDTIDISSGTLDAFRNVISSLEERGYTVRSLSIPIMEKAGSVYYIVQPAEASSNLARFDGVRYGLHIPGADVWDEYMKTRSGGFGNEVKRRIAIGTYVLSAGYYDAYYKKASDARSVMRAAFLSALRDVEVILLPTSPDVAFKEGAIQDPVVMYAEDRLTLQANLTALPALSVPMPTADLPRGLQIIGGYHAEETLFSYARAVESLVNFS